MMKQIVDGVDVSGCDKYPLHNKWQGSIIFCSGGCEKYPNCEYKQLVRKTQECEALRLVNSKLNTALGARKAGKRTFIDLAVENDRYKQALEKIADVLKKDESGDYDFTKLKILGIINEATESQC